ncbi:hypothetical protein RhiJN_28811 [Ceratobasidium sp. AG-Ba]|nr:hypothetical protein RhiJN_28811 [Ceratobasidium sp. AG-Ba]
MPSDNDEPAGSSSAVRPRSTITSRLHPVADVEFVTAPDSAPDIPTPEVLSAGGSDSELCDTDKGSSAESPNLGPARPESPTKTSEEKQCRICLAGAEEEPELGRLISPLCTRKLPKTMASNVSEFERVLVVPPMWFSLCSRANTGAGASYVASSASIVLFTIIVLLSSFLATWFVPDVDSINEPVIDERVRDSNSFFSFGTFVISPLDYYTYSWDTARDVFKMAVRTFSDLNPDDKFWEKEEEDDSHLSDDILDDAKIERVRGSPNGFKNTVKVQKSNVPRHRRPKRRARTPPSRFARIIRGFVYRFTTGLGVVGILSFLNLLFSFGLVAPLRLFGGTWNRGQRRGAAGDTASLVVLVFIIIGVARAVWLVYKLTRHIAQLLLRRAETAILEVGQVDEDPEPWSVWLRRIAHELPARIRAIPYRLLPGMIAGWMVMGLVQAWYFVRNWTRDTMGQMMQLGPQPAPQRGIFIGDW